MSASATSTTRSRLVPMRPRDPHEPGRTASTLELFFDLVFVVAVSIAAVQLHHALTENHVADGLISYAMVFFGIWWAWMNFTWFATSFATDDWLYRVLTIVQMAGVLVLAAGIEPAFADHDYTRADPRLRRHARRDGRPVAARLPLRRAAAAVRRQIYAGGIALVQVCWLVLLVLPAVPWPDRVHRPHRAPSSRSRSSPRGRARRPGTPTTSPSATACSP